MTSDKARVPAAARDIIEVTVAHEKLTADPDRISRLVRCVIEAEHAEVRYLGVILCGRNHHQELHERYLSDSSPTDVLAFNLEPEGTMIEGEVYVDLDTAMERYAEFGSTFEQEVDRYVVHGILHLTGYRDKDDDDRSKMLDRQESLLETCRNV